MNQKEHSTTQLTDLSGAVTGTQFRYLNIWPLLANAHYYFGGQAASVDKQALCASNGETKFNRPMVFLFI